VSKLAISLEEADEAVGWIDIILRSEIGRPEDAEALLVERKQVLAILAASYRTAKKKLRN
jgi:hypothetical protein